MAISYVAIMYVVMLQFNDHSYRQFTAQISPSFLTYFLRSNNWYSVALLVDHRIHDNSKSRVTI